jgi:hypothetical protein
MAWQTPVTLQFLAISLDQLMQHVLSARHRVGGRSAPFVRRLRQSAFLSLARTPPKPAMVTNMS